MNKTYGLSLRPPAFPSPLDAEAPRGGPPYGVTPTVWEAEPSELKNRCDAGAPQPERESTGEPDGYRMPLPLESVG